MSICTVGACDRSAQYTEQPLPLWFIANFGPLGTHESVYNFSNAKKSNLEMFFFMDLDSVNFRALQCGYNDVSYGNLTCTYSFVNHSGKEGMNFNRFYKFLFPYSVPTIIPIFLKFSIYSLLILPIVIMHTQCITV